MAFTHTFGWSFTGPGESFSSVKASSGNDSESLERVGATAYTGPLTNQLLDWGWDVSNTISIFLLSNVDLTVEVNNSTTPDAIIELKANVPIQWIAGVSAGTNPLGTIDVTKLYFTTVATGTVEFRLRALA